MKTFNRLVKNSYYETFKNFKYDIKGTWNRINEIFNKTKKHFITFYKAGDLTLHNTIVITNRFNIVFANIDLNVSNNSESPKDKRYHNCLSSSSNSNY